MVVEELKKKERKNLLTLTSLLGPLPILLAMGGCYFWKGKVDVATIAPFVAAGGFIMAFIFMMMGSKKRKKF